MQSAVLKKWVSELRYGIGTGKGTEHLRGVTLYPHGNQLILQTCNYGMQVRVVTGEAAITDHPVEIDFAGLSRFVRGLRQQDVFARFSEGFVEFRADDLVYRTRATPLGENVATIPTGELQTSFRMRFAGITDAAGHDDNRPALTGMLLDFAVGRVVCTDGFRMHIHPIEKQSRPGILIPAELIRRSSFDDIITVYEHAAGVTRGDVTFLSPLIAVPLTGYAAVVSSVSSDPRLVGMLPRLHSVVRIFRDVGIIRFTVIRAGERVFAYGRHDDASVQDEGYVFELGDCPLKGSWSVTYWLDALNFVGDATGLASKSFDHTTLVKLVSKSGREAYIMPMHIDLRTQEHIQSWVETVAFKQPQAGL